MSEKTILFVIIGITTFDFVLEKLLGILNNQNGKKEIPKELEGIYDQEKYQESQKYQSTVFNFSIVTSVISFVVMLCILVYGGFGDLNDYISGLTENEFYRSLIFVAILYFASDILGLPFNAYSTFVIEEKFGFNKTTVKTFVLDKVKGWLFAIILGGSILALLIKYT